MRQSKLPLSLLDDRKKVGITIPIKFHFIYQMDRRLSVHRIVITFKCAFIYFTFKSARVHLLDTESFPNTFGPKSHRKRPVLTSSDVTVCFLFCIKLI